MLSSVNYYNQDRHRDFQTIYYNVDIVNGKTKSTGNTNDPVAQFNETRDLPIISDASKYKMSIIRYTMDGIKDLPLFIPVIEANQPDPNKTIYTISISYKGTHTTMAIKYQPEDSNKTLLSAIHISQDVYNEYYYVHTYHHFVSLINNTFQGIINDINTQSGTTLYAPVMVFNSDNNKFDLYHAQDEDITIYFNTNLYNLCSHYPTKRGDQYNDDLAYQILPVNELGLNEVVLQEKNYIKVVQEAVSLGTFWSPISAIVFTSNILPIVAEGVAPPIIFGDSNISTVSSSVSAFEPIITDIALTLDNSYEYKQFISYIPTSQYRYVSFSNSNKPIKSININIYWKARLTGELVPLKMSNLSNISIKFLFEKINFI